MLLLLENGSQFSVIVLYCFIYTTSYTHTHVIKWHFHFSSCYHFTSMKFWLKSCPLKLCVNPQSLSTFQDCFFHLIENVRSLCIPPQASDWQCRSLWLLHVLHCLHCLNCLDLLHLCWCANKACPEKLAQYSPLSCYCSSLTDFHFDTFSLHNNTRIYFVWDCNEINF